MDVSNYVKAGVQLLPKTRSSKEGVKTVFGVLGLIGSAVLVFLAAYLPLTYRWSQSTWSDLSIEEIVYHLTMPMEGTGTGMITGHILQCLLPAILVVAAYVVIMLLIRKKVSFTGLIKGAVAALCAIIIANTVASFWRNMNVAEYVTHQSAYSSFIDENYVDPGSVGLTFPEQKRNLIYIFLESMENTFSDTAHGGAFEQDVIPELTQLSLENENFSGGNTQLNGGVPMTGATWTMGAMFAQTSGLPLMISIDKNAMSSQEEFFPGAVTLGDILAEQGYAQTLLLGSDAAFGGRELYFATHGNFKMADYNYYTGNGTLPPDYFVWWGYEDKYLFENAKTELAELSAGGRPFNLTMLTVDTHFEDGYVCTECPGTFGDQYSNVYACSSRQVVNFIDWLKQQPYYDNTTVVICGDHLTMDKDYCSSVPEDYQRTVYYTILNPAVEVQEPVFREFTTFDNFPTTLAAMGVNIPGNKLGLGTNLFSAEKTLLEIYGKDTFNEGISAKSELMDNLTAGISNKMVTLTPLDYNTETRSLQVIASDIKASGSGVIDYMKVNVWKGSDSAHLKTYSGVDRGDGTWIFTIPFADFAFESGSYTVVAVARDAKESNLAEYALGAVTVALSDPEMENTQEADAAFSGIRFQDYDYASGRFGVEYSQTNTDEIVSVAFAVWKNPDQSDLRWYQAEPGEYGVYSASVNAFDFAFNEKPYMVHAYVTLVDGRNIFRDAKNYTIQ